MRTRCWCKTPSTLHAIFSYHRFIRWSPNLKWPASRMFTLHGIRLLPYRRFLRKLPVQTWRNEFWRWGLRWSRACINISMEDCQSLIELSCISARFSTQGSRTTTCGQLEIPIDSGMDLSIKIDNLRVFINKTLSLWLRVLSTNYW